MPPPLRKPLDQPERTRRFPNGHVDLVPLGETIVAPREVFRLVA